MGTWKGTYSLSLLSPSFTESSNRTRVCSDMASLAGGESSGRSSNSPIDQPGVAQHTEAKVGLDAAAYDTHTYGAGGGVDDATRSDHSTELKARNAEDLRRMLDECTRTPVDSRRFSFPNVSSEGGDSVLVQFRVHRGSVGDNPLKCDVVVNAANETLEGGGGVDHAIHAAAGPELRRFVEESIILQPVTRPGGAIAIGESCRCPVGEAVLTPAFGLPHCKHICHTVAPLLREDPSTGEYMPRVTEMRACYESCLTAAWSVGAVSIGFCSLGTGFYGFPRVLGAQTAVGTVFEWLQEHAHEVHIRDVVFYVFGAATDAAYQTALAEVGHEADA